MAATVKIQYVMFTALTLPQFVDSHEGLTYFFTSEGNNVKSFTLNTSYRRNVK